MYNRLTAPLQYQSANGDPLPPEDRMTASYIQIGMLFRRKLQAPNAGQAQVRTAVGDPWTAVAGT